MPSKLDLDEFKKDEEKNIQMENDTNMLVISGKKKSKKLNEEHETGQSEQKKKRLTRKEKVKLEKVLERKEKTSRVRHLIWLKKVLIWRKTLCLKKCLFKRGELLEKLASIQIKPNELNLYSSVKNIGQKETKREAAKYNELKLLNGSVDIDSIDASTGAGGIKRLQVNVNSIAGSNKQKNKKMKLLNENEKSDESSEIDTDDMSTDSEVDLETIQKALEQHKLQQSLKNIELFKQNYKSNHNDGSDNEEKELINAKKTSSNIITKYVHVERREEIKVLNYNFSL